MIFKYFILQISQSDVLKIAVLRDLSDIATTKILQEIDSTIEELERNTRCL